MGTWLRVTGIRLVGDPSAVPPSSIAIPAEGLLEYVAETEHVDAGSAPDNLEIEWSGDLGSDPQESGAMLRTAFSAGTHTMTATGAAGARSLTVKAWTAEVKATFDSPLAISDKPQMPIIKAKLRTTGLTATVKKWTCRVRFTAPSGCPNAPPSGVINDDLLLTQTGGEQFRPAFPRIRGRDVLISVKF